MRFLHISDLHIGRRINGLSLMEDQRHMLSQVLEMARECDAVLVAGDVYDKAQPSAEAIRAVGDFCASLSRMGKPVLIVSGNHDTAEQVAYCRELLQESDVFVSPVFDGALACHVLRDAYGEVHVWLMPFIRPASVRPFDPEVRTYEDAVRSALRTAQLVSSVRNVLVAHQYVAGAEICESETRLIGGVDQVPAELFAGFDYVALGHLHSPQKLCGGRVCYCGSPIKYSLSEEKQRKAALLVTLGGKGELSVEERPFAPLHALRTVQGELAQVSDPENFSRDYVFAILTDEQLLLDPIGALRLTYPHLLGMRLQNSRTNDQAAVMEEMDAESFTPLEHFLRFYQAQNHDQPADDKRIAVMKRIIEEAEGKQHASDQA